MTKNKGSCKIQSQPFFLPSFELNLQDEKERDLGRRRQTLEEYKNHVTTFIRKVPI